MAWRNSRSILIKGFLFPLLIVSSLVFAACGGGDSDTDCDEGSAPTVLSTDPSHDAANVETDEDVVIQFSLPMDKPSVISNISFTGGGLSVPNTNSWSSSMRVILYPDEVLAENTTYTVAIGPEAESETGVPMGLGYVFSFKTAEPYVDPPETITIGGTVRQVSPASPAGSAFQGAVVSMYGVPYTGTTDISGEYTLDRIPTDYENYLRAIPSNPDLLTTNSRFMTFSLADNGKDDLDFPLLSEDGFEAYGVLCGIAAEDVNFNDAQIAGNIISGGSPVTGAEVAIENGNIVYYVANGTAGCSSTGSTANITGGFQFVIFNTCPSTVQSGEADVTVTGAGCSETVAVPVKSGELTFVEIVCD
ncbi:MAG: Ig-like domain-containing protein [Deltaproteobacteria bacterium]|nr:Ig-like domain-containing protein [Deltaproteobacteria bacterium]